MSHTKIQALGLLLCPFLFSGLPASAQAPAAPLTPAQAAALVGGPALITLHISGAPVPQAFDAVIRQAGLTPVDTTHLGAAPGQKVTLDLDRVPFWKAVSPLAEQTQIAFAEVGPQSDRAILQPSYGGRNPLAGRVSEASPFFVVAGSARRSSQGSVSYTPTGAVVTPSRQDLSVFLTLLVDPKIHLVPDTARLSVLEATDDAGHTLLASAPAESDPNTDARYVVETGVALSAQAGSRRIRRLRGIWHVTMIQKADTWEIADLAGAAGAAKTILTADGPAQLSVVSVQPQESGYRADLAYQGPTFGLAFRPASALAFGTTRLTDSQGTSVTGFAGSVRGRREDAEPTRSEMAEMSFPVHGPGALTPPLKLFWTLPTSLAQVDIPFEFTDLPLP